MRRSVFGIGYPDQKPLCCAAADGDLERVRFLVEEEGANANGKLYKDGTYKFIPLRGACLYGRLEMVKYLVEQYADLEITSSSGETCLMAACSGSHAQVVEYLLSCNVQLDRQCMRGKTALHYCVEGNSSGQEEVMQLLLNKGVNIIKDNKGLTPLHSAAMCGQAGAVQNLMASDLFTPEEQAEALELLGAWYASYKHDYDAAVFRWCQALELRKEKDMEVCGSPVAVYLNAIEVQEVDDYISMTNNRDQVLLQALFLLQRVLGPSHPSVTRAITNNIWHYYKWDDYERSISLGIHLLESMVIDWEALSVDFILRFGSLSMILQNMFLGRSIDLDSKARKNSFGEPLVHLIELAMREVRRYQMALREDRVKPKENQTDQLLRDVVRLISVVDLIPVLSQTTTPSTTLSPTSVADLPHTPASSLSPDLPMSYRLHRALYNLVKTGVCGKDGATLLHIACSRYVLDTERSDICHLPTVSIINLLLHVGADPNIRDLESRTPLHVVCSQPGQLYMPLVQALLDGGAHVDICDKKRVSPLDRLSSKEQRAKLCAVANTTLKCLAARAIACNPHLTPDLYRDQLTKDLEDFINMH